jgi:hypothetical protein
MKNLVCWIILSLTTPALAQDPAAALKTADERTYTPRFKGMKDVFFEMSSPEVTKHLNDQMVFGRVTDAVFRVYWTAQPERFDMDIKGMPAGFNEIKEELKASMAGRFEHVVPVPLERKFAAYELKAAAGKPLTLIATDPKGLMPVPEYELEFDADGRLQTLRAKKPVGIVVTRYTYAKFPWADSKGVLVKVEITGEEGPLTMGGTTEISYVTQAGIGLPQTVKTTNKQSLRQPGQGAPVERTTSESLQFKSYRVNVGEAMKWFLGSQQNNSKSN